MANIVLPYRWQKAPEYPVEVNWGHPLAKGLVVATPLGIPASGNWRDPLLREQAVATATNLPSPVVRQIGRAADFVSLSSQGLKFVKAPITAFPLTMSALFFYSGAGTAQTTMAYGRNSSGSGRFQLYETSSVDVRAFASNAAGTFAEATVASLSGSTWYQLAGVYKSATSRTAFANGRAGTENTTSIAFDWTPEAIAYGARYNAGWGLYANGAIQIPKIWNRELSQEELLADYENPWQVFKPLQRRIWVPVSAGGPTYTLTAAAGSFSLTGNAAGLTAARQIAAASGSYALTGNAAGLTAARTLTADSGSFTLTGNSANLTAARLLTAANGSFVLTGNDATLTYTPSGATYTLTAASGSFSLTGNAASLLAGRKLTADSGTFTLTGNAAVLARGYSMTASAGSFTLTGNSAGLLASRLLNAERGIFVLTGNAATLSYGAAVSVELIYKLLANRQELNATTGTFTIYDDDDATVLLSANAWEDDAATIPYRGGALKRIDRLA